MRPPASRTERLPQSVFSEITELADAHGSVNLSQGFPDFPAPDSLKEAACRAIRDDKNQYSSTPGIPALRQAIAGDFRRRYGVDVDPDADVTVCCGSTEAMLAAMLGLVEEGGEVVVFEPFYENYGPGALFAGATPRYVRLRNEGPAKAGKAGLHAVPRRWSFDPDELAAAFTSRTRAIVLNSPNNPTGKVFTREELETIAALCRRWDVIAFTDEIYEHLIYDGRRHVPLAAIDGMAERTVTIGSMSKTFSVTGWRVGWAIGPDKMSRAIRKVHDYLTVAAPTPLQEAAVAAFELPESYFTGLAAEYQRRRDLLTEILERHGFSCTPAEGAYYLMARIDAFGTDSDVAFARMLTSEIRVAAIPGSSFYSSASDVPAQLRFCFCKKQETIREADGRLSALGARRVPSRPSAR